MAQGIPIRNDIFKESAHVLNTFFTTQGIDNFTGIDFLHSHYVGGLKNTAFLLENTRGLNNFPLLACIFVILAAKKKFQIVLDEKSKGLPGLSDIEKRVNEKINQFLMSKGTEVSDAVSILSRGNYAPIRQYTEEKKAA